MVGPNVEAAPRTNKFLSETTLKSSEKVVAYAYSTTSTYFATHSRSRLAMPLNMSVFWDGLAPESASAESATMNSTPTQSAPTQHTTLTELPLLLQLPAEIRKLVFRFVFRNTIDDLGGNTLPTHRVNRTHYPRQRSTLQPAQYFQALRIDGALLQWRNTKESITQNYHRTRSRCSGCNGSPRFNSSMPHHHWPCRWIGGDALLQTSLQIYLEAIGVWYSLLCPRFTSTTAMCAFMYATATKGHEEMLRHVAVDISVSEDSAHLYDELTVSSLDLLMRDFPNLKSLKIQFTMGLPFLSSGAPGSWFGVLGGSAAPSMNWARPVVSHLVPTQVALAYGDANEQMLHPELCRQRQWRTVIHAILTMAAEDSRLISIMELGLSTLCRHEEEVRRLFITGVRDDVEVESTVLSVPTCWYKFKL